jgi:hypothetical protein
MGVAGWARMTREEKAALKERRVAALEDRLYHLALNAENEMVRINAAARLHAIYNGAPVARTITTIADDISEMSDDAIRAELARYG